MMRLLHTPLENFQGTWRDRGEHGASENDGDVVFAIFDGDITYSRDFRYEREELPDGRAIHRWRRVKP